MECLYTVFPVAAVAFLGLKRGQKAFSTAMSFFILFVNYFSVLKVPQDQLQQKQKQNCRLMFVDQIKQKYQKVQIYKMQKRRAKGNKRRAIGK